MIKKSKLYTFPENMCNGSQSLVIVYIYSIVDIYSNYIFNFLFF